MDLHFEYLYVLFLLLMIPGLYFLYAPNTIQKKIFCVKILVLLKLLKNQLLDKNFARKHLPFVLMMGVLGLIICWICKPSTSYCIV